MKILYLTGGAGQMYCGSCLRDNSLATELMARKHQVTLLPVYTPTLTDEANVSSNKVFFGGISVYLEQYVPLFRHSPKLLDRLWDSKAMIRLASRRSISVSPKMLGEMTVSMLKGEDGFQQKEIGKFLDWLKTEDIPDVVSLPYTLLLGMARPIKEALGRPISCTLQGEDLFLEGLHEPYRTESKNLIKDQLKYVDGFISVSEYYSEFMPNYLDIPKEKIHTVPLGINLDGYDRKESRSSETFRIGYFARLAPEKGLHVLAEAYQQLRKSGQLGNARLEVAGYLAPEHHKYLRDVENSLKDAGLANEFTYHGVVDREHKINFLKNLDVLSVPATYDEPKGLFLLEAMACGVPVVQPRRGGFTEIVEKTGGGLLVEPDNIDSLAVGLLSIHKDRALANELGTNGYQNVRKHFTVESMADRALEVYQHLINHA